MNTGSCRNSVAGSWTGEAQLVTLACSKPPDGRSRWTLRLLADRMVELGHVDTLLYETLRERNEQAATIDWQFTPADAKIKLKRLYPVLG